MNEIGIKLADGSFYPILEDAVRTKNIELTTVRDNQETVQIDLFRNAESLEYIGSLIVEDIALKKAGEATINLKISVDDDENLNAEVVDADSGAKQALKVSLATVGTNAGFTDFNLKDFELSQKDNFNSTESENIVTETNTSTSYENDNEKKGFPKWLAILLVLLGIGLLVLAVLLFTRSCSQDEGSTQTEKIQSGVVSDESTSTVPIPAIDDVPSNNQETTPPPAESEDDKETEDTETITSTDTSETSEGKDDTTEDEDKNTEDTSVATNVDKTTSTNDASNNADGTAGERLTTNPDGSVRYLIKWGDTLWDLAETFYKDPWDFKIIADHNKIKNPSLIISGTYIDIPAKK